MYTDVLQLQTLIVLVLQVVSYKIEVKIKQGILIGTRQTTVFDNRLYFAFYGIPYAQPPVGKLRFKDPKAQKKWKRPLDARTAYHGACAQSHIVHKHRVYGYEDCLRLNIYTPSLPRNDKQASKAVIIWVHGYAFVSSFSHIHGGDFLIDNDVILITVTHRVGVFGFLKANEIDKNANMGLKDIVMALKWIRRNIKEFNGDKNKITLMGSGSAATFLSLLLTTKSSKLFSKLILQSGSMFSPSILQGNHTLEKDRLLKQLRDKGIKDLNSATTKDIILTSQKIYKNLEVINSQKPLIPFLPILEDINNISLLTIKPKDCDIDIVNMSTNKTILIGFNSQESISEVIPFLHNPQLLKSLANSFRYMVPFSDGCQYKYTSKIYKTIGDEIRNEYFREGLSEKSIESFMRYTSDLQKYPVYKFIKRYLNAFDGKMYIYKFDYNGKFNAVKQTSTAGINIKVKGASSGDEVCYLLKCEPLGETYMKINHDINHRDRIFIKQIVEIWANFAKFGDPTPNTYRGNITWPPTMSNNRNLLLIGKKNKIIDTKSEEKMFTFWNKLYEKYYSSKHCSKIEPYDEL